MIYDLALEGICSEAVNKHLIESSLGHLLETAPSDSCANTKIDKNGMNYTGFLEVVSSQGRFVARTVCNGIDENIKSLCAQISSQINQWKSLRDLKDSGEPALSSRS